MLPSQGGTYDFNNLILGLLLCATSSWISAATEQSDTATELALVREEIARVSELLSSDKARFSEVREQAQATKRRLEATGDDLALLGKKIGEKEKRLADLRAERQTVIASLDDSRARFSSFSRSRFVLDRQTRLKLVFSGENPGETSRTLRYFEYLLAANQTEAATLVDEISDLKRTESALASERAKLELLRERADQQLATLTQAAADHDDLMTRIAASENEHRQLLEALRANENELTTLLENLGKAPHQALTQRPFSELKGSLSWPLEGKIISRPGERMRSGGAQWDGMLIQATPGAAVRSVAQGIVVYADQFPNLGLLVIIDHDDKYMTLYGFNDGVDKQAGDVVSAGEIVSKVGRNSSLKSAALYFEIRHDGSPLDVLNWLTPTQ
ncbi:MAG: peptidoglycan DD-metalloendopeptidase family protein [Pseudomonadota bacterium]